MPIVSMMMISVDPTKSSADSVTMPLAYLHRFVTGYPLQSGACLRRSLSAPSPDGVGRLDQHQ